MWLKNPVVLNTGITYMINAVINTLSTIEKLFFSSNHFFRLSGNIMIHNKELSEYHESHRQEAGSCRYLYLILEFADYSSNIVSWKWCLPVDSNEPHIADGAYKYTASKDAV